MRRTLLLLGYLLMSIAPALADDSANRTKGFDTALVRLLQPDSLFAERGDAKALSNTIKAIQTALSAYGASRPDPDSIDGCAVYAAIRSGERLKTWTQCEGEDRREIDAFIGSRIDKKAIAPVSEGALILSIHGIDANPGNLAVDLMPSEWRKAAEKAGAGFEHGLEMEQLIDLVWPDGRDA
jgi:hypothetical protein